MTDILNSREEKLTFDKSRIMTTTLIFSCSLKGTDKSLGQHIVPPTIKESAVHLDFPDMNI